MNKNKKFLLIALYISFLIILFEGSARLFFYLKPQYYDRLWVGNSLSWHRAWISRHTNTGTEIYYNFDMYDSTKGWVSKPNIKDMDVFDNKVLNTNSKGYRGQSEYFYNKHPNKIRILVLGDSYTFGEEVSDDETYPYYLQKIIQNSEVINLGVHGYGHDQMLISFMEEGIKYKPDIVVLGFIQPDMSRNMLNFRDFAKPKFILRNNKLKLTASPVPNPESTLKWDWTRPRIVDIISIIYHETRRKSGRYDREMDDLTAALLTKIAETSNSISAIPIFTYLPIIKEISDSTLQTPGELYLSDVCNNKSTAKYFSTRPLLIKKMNEGVTFKKRGHWGPAGNKIIAKAIKQYLLNEGYLTLQNSLE